MTKTIHPIMSHYSSRKWGEEEVGAYFKFRPIGGAIIRRLRLFDGGGGEGWGAIIRRFTVSGFIK